MYHVLSVLALAIVGVSANNAQFYGRCDIRGTLTRSEDNFVTSTTLGSASTWTQLVSATLTGVTANTKIRFVCTGDGAINGFLGQVTYDNVKYPTTGPLSDGEWTIASGSVPGIFFNAYALGSRQAYWGGLGISMFDTSAVWIDIPPYATVVFEFDFADIIDACGNYGKSLRSPHACQCASSCSGGYCNSFSFVEQRLNINTGNTDSGLCSDPAAPVCCCSCPNCYPFVKA